MYSDNKYSPHDQNFTFYPSLFYKAISSLDSHVRPRALQAEFLYIRRAYIQQLKNCRLREVRDLIDAGAVTNIQDAGCMTALAYSSVIADFSARSLRILFSIEEG